MDIKDKIRKLLRVTENSAATDGEIENAMLAAQQLLRAHQLELCDIDMEEDEAPVANITFAQHSSRTQKSSISVWEARLVHFICDFIGTVDVYNAGTVFRRDEAGMVIYNRRNQPRTSVDLRFYGPEEDCIIAGEMFADLCVLIVTMTKAQGYGGSWKGDGRSYAEGFVYGLVKKNEKVQKQLKADVQSTALVVQADKNAQLVRRRAEEWLKKEQGMKLQKGRKRRARHVNFSAWTAGRDDGQETTVTARQARKRLER